MQAEKQYLLEENAAYLDRTDYVVFTEFTGLTVAETEELRRRLAGQKAEFHVVKNRIFRRVAEERGVDNLEEWLTGQTAIVIGGEDIAGVIKELEKFQKEKKKLEIKGGILGKQGVDAEGIVKMKDMPPLEVVKAQLLGLLNQPAQQLVQVMNAVPTQMVTVLSGVPRNLINVLQQRSQQES